MNVLHNRDARLIYRDMIRLVRTVMERNKQIAVLPMIRKEFEKNKNLKDESEILKLKKNACQSLGNLYLLYVKNTIKDDKFNPDKDKLL